MIYDSLKNCERYTAVHEGFAKAFDFIKEAQAQQLPEGRYELDGENIYAFIQSYTSKQENESSFEAHGRYIDIQYIISGVEVMQFADVAALTASCEYDAQRDVVFFDDYDKAGTAVVHRGEYGIFFPWDAHKPGMCFGGKPDTVCKIVVKVKL